MVHGPARDKFARGPCLRQRRPSAIPEGTRRLGQREADAEPQERPGLQPFLYRYRNLVERFFNKLKHFRAVATRFEKHDPNYLALVKLAAAKNLDAVYGLVT